MFRRSWLFPFLPFLAPLTWAQVHINDNPTIDYTTPAVPAYKAIDDIGRIAEKKIRVVPPIGQQPIILKLHGVPYKDVLKAIATALNGAWIDKDNYKILSRTNYSTLKMENTSVRARAAAINDYLASHQTLGNKPYLTAEQASKYILALYKPDADKNSAEYQIALKNSAGQRLIDRAIQGVQPLDVARAPYPSHIVFSDVPRLLQGALRLSATDRNQIMAEQNTWTTALKKLAATHPELKAEASKRLPIENAGCRILLVFSDPVNDLPTHVAASVVGGGGYARVQGGANISIPVQAPISANNWGTSQLGQIALDNLSTAFANAALSDSGSLPADVKEALLGPSRIDPLQFIVSDGLLKLANTKGWNLVACPPDTALLDPALWTLASSGTMDGAAFLTQLEKTSTITQKDYIMSVSPIDTLDAELSRTNRTALEVYLASLERIGYSSTPAEATLISSTRQGYDPVLVKFYSHLLHPTATPFLDTSLSSLGLYGSFTPDQRKSLIKELTFQLNDLADPQKKLLGDMLLDAPRRVIIEKDARYILTNPRDPEITNLVDSPTTPGETVSMSSRQETVLRINAVDSFGRPRDEVLTYGEAAAAIKRQGPWRSISYATAPANIVKITIRATDTADVVHFLWDFPQGFSAFSDVAGLPVEARRALNGIKNPPKKPATKPPKKPAKTGKPGKK